MTGLIVLLMVIIGTLLAVFRNGLTPRIQTLFFLRYELLLLVSPVLLVLLAWMIPSVTAESFYPYRYSRGNIRRICQLWQRLDCASSHDHGA